jgi:hypothetical protein
MGRRRVEWYEDPLYYYPYPVHTKPYGASGFLGDCFMLIITGGLWAIWIFVREMRRR